MTPSYIRRVGRRGAVTLRSSVDYSSKQNNVKLLSFYALWKPNNEGEMGR